VQQQWQRERVRSLRQQQVVEGQQQRVVLVVLPSQQRQGRLRQVMQLPAQLQTGEM
jgi:hypothetical protein